MEEIEILIKFIQKKYNKVSNKWIKNKNYYPLNMKRNRVEDLYGNEKLITYVFNYRKFLKEENVANLPKEIEKLHLESVTSTRIKTINSIQDKIEKYQNKKEKGKIAIKKCLNDIFGIRLIVDKSIGHSELKEYISNNFKELKCITANRGDYKATHIYFGNDDNTKFQWELQIWNKKDEHKNLISHEKYKQKYTKWENEK